MKYRYQLGKKHYETAQTTTAAILLLPTLIALTFLFLIPVVRLFSLSLTSTNTITNQSTYIGLKNYAYLLKNAMFQKAFSNTLFFTVTKLALEIVISLVLAVMLDMYIPWRKFLRISYFLPVIVPVVASSIIWMWLYDPAIGPLNQLLRFLGLPTSNYIYAESSALMSIVAFAVWRGIGYDIIIFISGLQGISDSVVEAARIDGANEGQIFRHVKLPLLSPIVMFVVMMGMIGCFQAFTEVDIMTGGGPNNSTMLYALYVYNQAFKYNDMGYACAMSWFMLVVMGLITFIIFKTSKFWVFSEAN